MSRYQIPSVLRSIPFMDAFFSSGVDEKYYKDTYADVAMAGVSATHHYYEHGWKEGRNPSGRFHTLYFIVKYMKHAELSQNPLQYYLANRKLFAKDVETWPHNQEEWNALQKRIVGDRFDSVFYQNKYADVLESKAPIDHYFSAGWRLGLDPREDFSTNAYLRAHPHLNSDNVNPFFHHLVTSDVSITGLIKTVLDRPRVGCGIEKKAIDRATVLRAIADHFDADFYRARNTDVREAGANPLLHYADYGWLERRNPSSVFWTDYYMTTYPEVAESGLNPLFHYVTIGMKKGYLPNPVGTSAWPRPTAPAEKEWASVAPAMGDDGVRVTVIIPVYRGYDDTLAAIHSVLKNKQKSHFDLLVVNDCGPEPELTEKLRDLARLNLFVYVENDNNMGFVRTVNKALKLRPGNDVVLLNADAVVYGDWLDRILAHADADPTVATITPFSNNASICGYPLAPEGNFLALECSFEELDRYAAICNRGGSSVLPTGVGFCFYMRRRVVDEIGDFDIVFGRGYGEENDFCMRALKAGYKNLLAHDVVVYHSGEVSFDEFRAEEYGPGQLALWRKHPDYTRRVKAFVQANPARLARMRLDLYRLVRRLGERTALFVSIETSGGVDSHVRHVAARLEEAGVSVLFLYVGVEDRECFSIRPFSSCKAVYAPTLTPVNLITHATLIADLLDWLEPEIIHVQSLALLKWEPTRVLMSLLAESKRDFFVTLHDYDSICHRHHLVDLEGRYCNPMEMEACRDCVRMDPLAVDRVDPIARREAYAAFLASARKVFVPSQDAAKRLNLQFPHIRFAVREHEERLPARAATARKFSPPLRIATIGAIGPHKGSNLLFNLAFDAKLKDLPIRYSIVGYSAIVGEMQEVGVVETGRYTTAAECMDRLEEIQPDFILFPSIWPETYCYALSIALALGIPPIVFDLGAQADRVREAGFGVVLDNALLLQPGDLNTKLLSLSVSEEWAKRKPIAFARYETWPQDYYR